MPPRPDSGHPRNIHEQIGLAHFKPAVINDATWSHISAHFAEVRELKTDGEHKAEGGQAVVLEAKEKEKPNRRVAIKVYKGNSDADRKLFEREVAAVGSPHLPRDLVVEFFGCCRDSGLQPYLVLERIDGRDPVDYVQNPEPLSMSRRIALFERYCRAMQRLHDGDLVLRDVNAGNVLIEPGDKIRFIDFAAVTSIAKGLNRSTVRIPLATPDTVPIEVLRGEIKASQQTDLYAAVGIGFHMLTGKAKGDVLKEHGILDENHAQAATVWESELKLRRVPRTVRAIIIKGLGKKDPREDGLDPHVYATIGAIADDIARWKTSIEQLRRGALLAALLLIVALPGALGWFKWNELRQTSELVTNRRLIGDLQQQVGELTTREHVAVKKLLDDAGQAARRMDEAQTRGEPLSVSLKFADEVQSKLRQALEIGDGIERGTKQRTALGSVLLEQDRVHKSQFWATDAPTIRKRLDDLQKRYVAIGKRIEAGDVSGKALAAGPSIAETPAASALPLTTRSDLGTQLAELQADLIALFEDNLLARQALQVRATYERDKRSVSERVQKLEGFVLIHKTAQDGEQEFELGDFKAAATNFGRAVDRLEEYLKQPNIETAEEKQNRQRVTVDLVKVLETDKAQLQSRIAQLTGDVDAKLKHVSDLQTQITQLSAKQLEDQAARTTAETKLAAAEIKAKDFDQTKASLTKTTTELETAKKTLTTQQKKLIEVEPKLAQAEQDRDQFQREADRWKKRATENPGAVIPFNEKLAEIEKDLGKLDTKNWDATQAAFVKAGAEYRKIEVERAALVAPNKFEAKHPKVKEKDKELAQAQSLLEAALKKLDNADRFQFDALQKQIDSRQKLHDEERGLGVAEQNTELVDLRRVIASLKQKQTRHADGNARAAGTGKSLALKDLLALGGGFGLPSTPGEVRDIKVAGVDLPFVAIPLPPNGKFKMGTPPSESGHQDDETQVDVTLTVPYAALKTEITQAMYTAVTKSSPWQRKSYVKEGAMYPAAWVSANDADLWCQKATAEARQTGAITARERNTLPTEAQWEWMARGGTTTAYFHGLDDAKLGDFAWYDQNAWGIGEKYAHEVVKKKPNPYWLLDTSGNVWEWCRDTYSNKLPGGTNP